MDLYVLDKSFNPVGIIDTASSVIWTERYYEVGDFEIYIQADKKHLELLQEEYYVTRTDSRMVGIIEKIALSADAENGDYLTVSGRDLKSLLDRRIIWNQANLTGSAETILRTLIDDNVINPSDTARQIPGVKLGELKNFTEELELQATGENLLTKVIELCKASEIGWRTFLDEERSIVIDFYRGENRSYSQADNPYVVFSPEFDNLLSTETSKDITALKNVALVAGEGEGTAKITAAVGSASGMDRREVYVDASSISSNGGEISPSQYLALLQEKGREQMAAAAKTLSISGTADPALTYKLNEDYFLGDTVAVTNEYGIGANAKILEIIESEDDTGYQVIPTFEEWRLV